MHLYQLNWTISGQTHAWWISLMFQFQSFLTIHPNNMFTRAASENNWGGYACFSFV